MWDKLAQAGNSFPLVKGGAEGFTLGFAYDYYKKTRVNPGG